MAVLVIGFTYRPELTEVYNRVVGEVAPAHAINTDQDTLAVTASLDGHYYVFGKANGERIRFLIDTGATDIMLTPQDASRIGIDLERLNYNQQYNTANGTTWGASYRLDSLSIGSFDFADIKVSVNESNSTVSLLGMSFLDRLKSFEFRDSKLYMKR